MEVSVTKRPLHDVIPGLRQILALCFCIYILRGLMRCLSLVKACEGLKVGWQLQSPTLFLVCRFCDSIGTILYYMHIGSLIRQKVNEKGMTIVRFAEHLSCTRANAYKIFARKSIDTDTLYRVSLILDFDFFNLLSKHYLNSVSK